MFLDEITMTRGIDDSDHILGGFKLPEGDVNGDATFTLCLQLVENPGILERSFSKLLMKQY